MSCAVFLLAPLCLALGQLVSDCSDPLACNYSAEANGFSDCDFCSCVLDTSSFFTLSVEEYAVDLIEGQTSYRVYLNATNPTDVISAVFGSNEYPLSVSTTSGFYNNTFGGVTGSDINPFMLGLVPALAANSWVTIGVEDSSEGDAVSTLESPDQPWVGCFAAGSALDGEDFVIDDIAGGGWYVLGTSPNGIAGDDQRVLLMQITTAGVLEGVLNVQIFPLGDGDVRNTYAFSGEGVYFDESLPACGCIDPSHTIMMLKLLRTMALVLIPSPAMHAMAHASMMRTTMASVMSWKCWAVPTLKHAITTPLRRAMTDRVNSRTAMIAMGIVSLTRS